MKLSTVQWHYMESSCAEFRHSLLRKEHLKITDTVVQQTVRSQCGKSVKCLSVNKPPATNDWDKKSRGVAVGIAALHNQN